MYPFFSEYADKVCEKSKSCEQALKRSYDTMDESPSQKRKRKIRKHKNEGTYENASSKGIL